MHRFAAIALLALATAASAEPPRIVYIQTSANTLRPPGEDDIGAYVNGLKRAVPKASVTAFTGISVGARGGDLVQQPGGKALSGAQQAKLDYIGNDVRQACNIGRDAPILETRPGTAGDGHKGHALWSALRCAFKEKLDRTFPPLAKTALFGVIDHNSTHTLSAVLVDRAFRTLGRTGSYRVLVNVDNHIDYVQGQNADPGFHVRCDNWVNFAMGAANIDKFLYFGPTGKGTGTFSQSRHAARGFGAAAPFNKVGQDPAPFPTLASQITHGLGGAGEKPIDIYVSVDRDFMKGSCTPWGDGAHTQADGRSAIAGDAGILGTLKKLAAEGKDIRVVGFDVVGLPDGEGKGSGCGDVGARVTQARGDIAAFYEAFAAAPGVSFAKPKIATPRRPPTKGTGKK